MKIMRPLLAGMILVGAFGGPLAAQEKAPDPAPGEKHFDAKGKQPSIYTIEVRQGVSATLPFEDKRDFDEAKKGFIAEPPFLKIMADAGNVAWDMGSYQWLLQGKDFQSLHPSLQRQAVLNMAYGLYEVVPDRIYQVRGFDLANISLKACPIYTNSSFRSRARVATVSEMRLVITPHFIPPSRASVIPAPSCAL